MKYYSISNANYKRVISILGKLISLALMLVLVTKLVKNADIIKSVNIDWISILSFTAAAVYSFFMVVAGAVIWAILLKCAGCALGYRKSFEIIGKAQIGKYLPGNIFQYVGRVALGRNAGVPGDVVLVSLGAEAVLGIAAAAFLAVIGIMRETGGLGSLRFPAAYNGSLLYPLGVAVCIAIVGVLFFSDVLRRVRLFVSWANMPRILSVVLLYIIVFLLLGGIILFLQKSVWQAHGVSPGWFKFSWRFALSWVAGYFIPGSPGGLGVREAVFVGLTGQDIDEGEAILLIMILRLLMIVGDLFAFIVASFIGTDNEYCSKSTS